MIERARRRRRRGGGAAGRAASSHTSICETDSHHTTPVTRTHVLLLSEAGQSGPAGVFQITHTLQHTTLDVCVFVYIGVCVVHCRTTQLYCDWLVAIRCTCADTQSQTAYLRLWTHFLSKDVLNLQEVDSTTCC